LEKQLEVPLRAAIAYLEQHGHSYSIIGGIALAQWGVIRATRDVDIKVLVPDTDYPAIRKGLRAAFPERARAHVPENPFIVAVYIEGVIVDFLLALPGYEELIIERAVQRDLGGWSAWICSAEDLIIQKASAGRDKDWSDIEALLIEQHDSLDQGYIEEWLPQFVEALENPQILERYHQLVEKVDRYK
jgi:hypothetical protein